ncbi:MAG: adenylate/guanylate cyclase domain-containing protein [Spirochaetales bacterium]|nr:adenylate/guanylate cyclase domain-containing protein [Spirochaetales bacterium]
MKIRERIIFIVLPLLIASVLISGIFASYSARSGMTRLAMGSLGFKAEEMKKYMNNQWSLLVDNGLSDQQDYIDVAEKAILSYANSLLRSDTELIFALDDDCIVQISTGSVDLKESDVSTIKALIQNEHEGWTTFSLSGEERVGHMFHFDAFEWWVFISEDNHSFYKEVSEMMTRNYIILASLVAVSFILLMILSSYITGPLTRVSSAMMGIVNENDLSRRVEIEYKDEIGQLANTFNLMINELERAYQQIKEYAFKAILAERNERKIRNIFQKYVPKDVIDSVFDNPEQMLVGQNRELGILFSDIRSFTTISEGYTPDKLVIDLNQYFEKMVDIIINRGGVIDKYIGDAIMAFFGAPVKHADDSYQAVMAALEMQETLRELNSERIKLGKPEFKTGIGISYGVVTVGNIGSEKKMDYTIIGDMVNLGSRLEGLTKQYKQDVIIGEQVYKTVQKKIPCRFVDKVQVKGQTRGESIYSPALTLTKEQRIGWHHHNKGASYYYRQNFRKAGRYFTEVLKYLPGDYLAETFIQRCKNYIKSPPPVDWNGVEILKSK